MTAAAAIMVVSGLAATGAASAGLWAAWLWLRASRVQVNPIWGPTGLEPADPQQAEAGWITGLLVAGQEGAELNTRAARWTAAAVALTAMQSAAGFLASAFG